MNKDIIERSFGGIVSNNIQDFLKEDNNIESARSNMAFHNKMLKAYLKGHEYFNFGYKGRDSYGRLIPNTFAVLVNN